MSLPTITLVPAAIKKQELLEARKITTGNYGEYMDLVDFQLVLKMDIAYAKYIPCTLKSGDYPYYLQDSAQYAMLSDWLREAGYCLHIVDYDTHDRGHFKYLTLGYYTTRGYTHEGAIAFRVDGCNEWVYF